MAEANPWMSRIQCRYYAIGSCREGENCMYLHDSGNVKSTQSPNTVVCKFFLKGQCTFGDQCRFKHTNSVDEKFSKNRSCRASTSQDGTRPKSSKTKSKTESAKGGHSSKMTVLKKGSTSSTDSSDSGIGVEYSPVKDPEAWVKAPEFVPGVTFKAEELSYSGATKSTLAGDPAAEDSSDETHKLALLTSLPAEKRTLCPWLMEGECRYEESCVYTHGLMCDMCERPVIHPYDTQQNQQHREDCMKEMERDMELSFAIARSKDKTCGICMDVVLEKDDPIERRFGLLSDCNHCFCLSCIRKWRQVKQFENKVIRSCPECRVTSDFVTPSKYWAEDAEDKKKLITGYKEALSKKPCRYFDQGRGECPFNEKCFYKHAYPNGRIAEPKPRARRVHRDSQGDLDLLQHILLWDFIESRDNILDVIDELFYQFSDTEDDSDCDYDFLYLHL